MSRIYKPYLTDFEMPHYFMYHQRKNSANYNYVIKFKMHPDFKDVKVKNKMYALLSIKYDK